MPSHVLSDEEDQTYLRLPIMHTSTRIVFSFQRNMCLMQLESSRPVSVRTLANFARRNLAEKLRKQGMGQAVTALLGGWDKVRHCHGPTLVPCVYDAFPSVGRLRYNFPCSVAVLFECNACTRSFVFLRGTFETREPCLARETILLLLLLVLQCLACMSVVPSAS